MEPLFLSLRDYAAAIGVSTSTLKRLLKEDPDAATKVDLTPGRRGFPTDEVRAHAEKLRERQAQRATLQIL